MSVRKMLSQSVLLLSLFLAATAMSLGTQNDENAAGNLFNKKHKADSLYQDALVILHNPEYQERQVIMTDSSQLYRSARIETRNTKFLDLPLYKIEQDIFWNGVDNVDAHLIALQMNQTSSENAEKSVIADKQLADVLHTFTEISEPQQFAHDSLVKAALEYHHLDSLYTLAQLHLWNDYGFVGNKSQGLQYLLEFDKVCIENAYPRNVSVLFEIGVAYSTGLFEQKPDHLKALVYYQAAADLGSLHGMQALAYRYYTGFGGVPKDCSKAQMLYSALAEELRFELVNTKTHDMPWDVLPKVNDKYNIRVCDLKEGLIGESELSSVFSKQTKSRLKAKIPDLPGYGLGANAHENPFNQIINNLQNQPLQLNAGRRGGFNVAFGFPTDMNFNVMFGDGNNEYKNDQLIYQYYDALNAYEGTFFFERNVTYAVSVLTGIYKNFDEHVYSEFNEHQKYFYSKALDLLGHIILTAEVFEDVDYDLAKMLLLRAKEIVEFPYLVGTFPSRANVDLGIIAHYHELNFTKAQNYYKQVINTPHDDGTASYNYAKLKLAQRNESPVLSESLDIDNAAIDILIQRAVYKGYDPALYMWSKTKEGRDNGRFRCEDIVLSFKTFTEDLSGVLSPFLKKSFTKYINSDDFGAIWGYAMAAELGYEEAQTSVAYMLASPLLMFEEFPSDTPDLIKNLAISYYVRSYKQNNVDAGLVAGDMYYQQGDYERAAALYQGTATKFSVQGLWNLAYMYEKGLGVEKDYHLAKRYYEQVLEHKPLYMAVKLSVLRLQFLYFWNKYFGAFHSNKLMRAVLTKSLQVLKKISLSIEKIEKLPAWKLSSSIGKKMVRIHPSKILDTLEGYGIDSELLISLITIGLFFLFPLVLTRLAVRNGWNVVINGVPINPPPRPREPAPAPPVRPPELQAPSNENLQQAEQAAVAETASGEGEGGADTSLQPRHTPTASETIIEDVHEPTQATVSEDDDDNDFVVFM